MTERRAIAFREVDDVPRIQASAAFYGLAAAPDAGDPSGRLWCFSGPQSKLVDFLIDAYAEEGHR